MNIIEILSSSNIEEVSLIFQSLLNRTPILIIGSDEFIVEELINSLTSFMPFRNILIFFDDFIHNDDYQALIENEEVDIETERNLFISFPNSVNKVINLTEIFFSWIVGCTDNERNRKVNEIIWNKFYINHDFFLKIDITDNKIKAEVIGRKFHPLDLTFERWLFQNAINRTEISIEKMKRVIAKSYKKSKISEADLEELMDFSFEELELKENILKKEIINFFQACKRTFSVLNRLKNIESFGFSTKISTRTIYSTIAYKFSSIGRILEFIEKNWKINFFTLLDAKKTSNFTDTFESLWG
ncbi:hypothetical protein NEF87_002702 [Candidatus Lokiarchaeum ossiferum]|uniref:DUF4435 domain-containing protein n=1 Tax=Candidatus Lokiarchaeum ossiferum TaxID=2951803 RepID=A0ABY6HVN0_9ARCH|nr:hypothetical protein NEF87_002702 [Candidatus Lokiarchaeum sp. B-35]